MMIYTNPRFANEIGTSVFLDVVSEQETVVFIASANDVEPSGVDLYKKAIAGEFGQVAAFTPPVVQQPTQAEIDAMRKNAYQQEADPIFFKWQRGEATQQDWLDKIAEIRLRYPDVDGL